MTKALGRCPRAFAVALLMAALPAIGHAQATWSTQVVIPDMLTIRVPTTILAFTPGQPLPGGGTAPTQGPNGCPMATTYPPAQFPACYPIALSGGNLPVDVFSNIRGPWSLLLDVADLSDDTGTARLPSDRIWFRVGQGSWQRAGATSSPLYFGTGPTEGFMRLDIQFALELDGTERAGSFATNAVVSALRQP